VLGFKSGQSGWSFDLLFLKAKSTAKTKDRRCGQAALVYLKNKPRSPRAVGGVSAVCLFILAACSDYQG